MGARADSTSRVTSATAAWFWRRGSRIVVAEVGLTRQGACLEPPWGSVYRVDLVASLGAKTHVIEVKGTQADLNRENLSEGKWVLPYPNLVVWLAVDDGMTVPRLDEKWGILRVKEESVRVERPAREVDDGQRTRHLEVLARVLCMQSLPRMMGLTSAGQLAALETNGFSRPWRRWHQKPAPVCEEPGRIL
jgi:hypothetical protein